MRIISRRLLLYGADDKVTRMSVRMRHTRGHTGNRRSHHALKKTTVIKDKESGVLRLPHRVDEETGMYRGKQIFEVKPRGKERVALRTAAREEAKKKFKEAHESAKKAEKAEQKEKKGSKGILGRVAAAARPRSRSGMGGGA